MDSERKFFLLKIQLCDTEIPVWRTFVVPSEIKLDLLHIAIQIVMGWENYHLHTFEVDDKTYTIKSLCDDGEMLNEKKFALKDLISKTGDALMYTYDMGDDWMHLITLEDSDYKNASSSPAHCIDGKGTCPPEDVGGVYGFEYFCEVINNPKHKEYKQMYEWVYEQCGYDKSVTWPDDFNLLMTSRYLACRVGRRFRPKKKKT